MVARGCEYVRGSARGRRTRGVAPLSYDLTRLGPVGFQDLAAALAIARFGANIHPMGAGRDGGRDLYFRRPLIWQRCDDTQPGEVWDGYTVFQVNHKAVLAARPADNASWLWTQVRAELNEWADPDSDRARSGTISSSSRTSRSRRSPGPAATTGSPPPRRTAPNSPTTPATSTDRPGGNGRTGSLGYAGSSSGASGTATRSTRSFRSTRASDGASLRS
jgi:hypothetical protein